MFGFTKEKIEYNFDKDCLVINKISTDRLKLNIKCCECSFFTGVKCHGHGDFWGNCTIYRSINIFADYYDSIVYDDSYCKVIKFLKEGDKNGN